ncbi:MAG: UDP-N-acetylmuramoyl-L-alanine--D-glutamate ligase [Chitinophagales bacterium]|nr:UDP-N-acetylmuramoyl-L-alanine--D-glutamate ligase [Chitinophagales bacterium]
MAKKVVILGSGESGTGAAILAKQKGFDVFVSDKGSIKDIYKYKLEREGIDYEEGDHNYEIIFSADEIIKSPGVQEKYEVMKKVRERNIPVVGEIEFAYRYCDGKIIAITGSNGKSTCTALTYHILHKAGLDVVMGGNIGISFAELVATSTHAYYVLEISNFQLDDTVLFQPYIAILLNITPDHLDSYNYQFEKYVDSKFRIAMNQTASDYFIYCADDEVIKENIRKYPVHATQLSFTLHNEPRQGAWVEGDTMIIQFNQNKTTMTISELALQGKHNQYNSMAAAIASHVLDIKKESTREALSDFMGLEHRLEFVGKVHGISFINDSKATNVNSTWYALETQETPVIWIAGGVDKGNDYSLLVELVKKKVKAIICLGADNLKLHESFSKHVDLIINTNSMEEAVQMAYRVGKNGDVVLLSPACASFDLFENFEDRGNQFKQKVREL